MLQVEWNRENPEKGSITALRWSWKCPRQYFITFSTRPPTLNSTCILLSPPLTRFYRMPTICLPCEAWEMRPWFDQQGEGLFYSKTSFRDILPRYCMSCPCSSKNPISIFISFLLRNYCYWLFFPSSTGCYVKPHCQYLTVRSECTAWDMDSENMVISLSPDLRVAGTTPSTSLLWLDKVSPPIDGCSRLKF